MLFSWETIRLPDRSYAFDLVSWLSSLHLDNQLTRFFLCVHKESWGKPMPWLRTLGIYWVYGGLHHCCFVHCLKCFRFLLHKLLWNKWINQNLSPRTPKQSLHANTVSLFIQLRLSPPSPFSCEYTKGNFSLFFGTKSSQSYQASDNATYVCSVVKAGLTQFKSSDTAGKWKLTATLVWWPHFYPWS